MLVYFEFVPQAQVAAASASANVPRSSLVERGRERGTHTHTLSQPLAAGMAAGEAGEAGEMKEEEGEGEALGKFPVEAGAVEIEDEA